MTEVLIVVGLFIAVLVLASRLHEVRVQLAQARRERDLADDAYQKLLLATVIAGSGTGTARENYTPGWQEAHNLADVLAAALGDKGFPATVHKVSGHADGLRIEVDSGRWRLVDCGEQVYVAPDREGTWWFWWSTLDPIVPVSEVSAAADRIARVIGAIPDSTLQRGTAHGPAVKDAGRTGN